MDNIDNYAYWEYDYNNSNFGEEAIYNCSACGQTVFFNYAREKFYSIEQYDYCPHCGRRMIHNQNKKENK